ncbi:hypothetical protein B0T25DRAFT_523064 [Lasiosphaeria hispida]|uniref:Uncharacterized protein n=1 Tax=Lasiosphaeria hispida TaxID=260671 RepID=A0AAJ0H7R7_9PEZI|nr:hypothetical protein B0T25DRAFT_523064 [Lasiosphaeria hispida]
MSDELLRPIKNSVWYYYETGNLNEAMSFIEIGKSGCAGESNLDYAHLCGHGACVLYELNDVPAGHRLINRSLEIRTKLLNEWDGQLGNTFSNSSAAWSGVGRPSPALFRPLM